MRLKQSIPSNLYYSGFDVTDERKLDAEKVKKITTFINSNFEKRKTINTDLSSYFLKHLVEDKIGEYVSNGELICAMIKCQFAYKRLPSSPNCYFNVKKTSLKNTENLPDRLNLTRIRFVSKSLKRKPQ